MLGVALSQPLDRDHHTPAYVVVTLAALGKIVNDFDRQSERLRDYLGGLARAQIWARDYRFRPEHARDAFGCFLRLLPSEFGNWNVGCDIETAIAIALALAMTNHDQLAHTTRPPEPPTLVIARRQHG